MPRHAELAEIILPDFGLPTVEPVIPPELYAGRLDRLRERARAAGFDVMLVYGDREHFANLTYLTGFDPRFEEALLVIPLAARGDTKPLLLVGNEGLGYARISPIFEALEVVLFQSFSLLGQPRGGSRPLDAILRDAGVRRGATAGVAGWKHYGATDGPGAEAWLEIPSYIADTLRELTGDAARVRNANALLMDATTGLRATNEAEQLARFEFAATFASQAVRNVLFGVRLGMTEFETAEMMRLNGLPLATHVFLSAGPNAFLGMASPTMRRIGRGEPFTACCSPWGALTTRAGFLVERAEELPEGIRDYINVLIAPYFEAIAAWYETVGIGVAGDELYAAIHERIGDPFFGVGLNPGHLIHLDEWVHSPIYRGSEERLRSGMALQVDVIPATGTAYYTTNIEDGIALADEALRGDIAARYPEAWGRIQARRAFMREALGIRLKPEVLPFSNIPAYLPPFVLAPGRAMRMV